MYALEGSRTLRTLVGSNTQAILEPSPLGFLNFMQVGKDHTFIGESLPCKQNA